MANINVTSVRSVVTGDNSIINLNISGGGAVTITADPTDNVDVFKVKFLDDIQADSVTVDLCAFAQDDLRIDILQYDPKHWKKTSPWDRPRAVSCVDLRFAPF